jgi:molecular chaperone DnaK
MLVNARTDKMYRRPGRLLDCGDMSRIVGIDLGTTNSLVAFLEGGRPEIAVGRAGQRSTPSVVGLDKQGQLFVGAAAKNQLLVAPERTVAEVKRLMGTAEKVRLGDRSYAPTEISAVILRSLKEDAEKFLDDEVREAVITVPAYFTDAQRQATKDAGELAGLVVERIVNEPTAAALAYGLDRLDAEQHVLVYDLGGGTFDVSVLEMFSGVLDVKASAGNNRLGGGDLNRVVARHLREAFERAHGVDLSGDARATARLEHAAEEAKIILSTAESTTVLLPFLAQKDGQPLSLEHELSRADFERLVGALLRSTLEPVTVALADAKLDRRAITDVVLVGGSTRVPLVRKLVAEYFGKEPMQGVHADEAVALGAAVQAGLKSGAISSHGGIMITDVSPFTLGVEVMSRAGSQHVDGMFSPIIPRNSTVPVSRTEVYSTTADNQRQVTVRVFQGESPLTRKNVFLDQYTVDGIPPAPAGHERVGITFTYDVNGILDVSTKVMSTGKLAALRIEKSPNRMNAADRQSAKQRLDREVAPARAAAVSGSASVSGSTSGSVSGSVSGSASVPVPVPVSVSGSGSPAADDANALLAAARARLPGVPAAQAGKLRRAIADLDEAIDKGDAAAVSRLDGELTDLLFELS